MKIFFLYNKITDHEDCTNKSQADRLLNFKDFQLIAVNDTHTFINGSLTFLEDVKKSFPVTLHGEHYERGQWLTQGYVQKIKNFCQELHNPLQPWYYISKKFNGCPISKGVS